ncbi:MAG: hypothetical protein K2R98_14130 [Gemmataceae bacterium]|nr:hypothetical protein [Gemmataceae bacterium]
MALFGHHAKAIIDLEIMGHELTPDTTTEHVVFAAVSLLILTLMAYGAFALVRDVFRWRRRAAR